MSCVLTAASSDARLGQTHHVALLRYNCYTSHNTMELNHNHRLDHSIRQLTRLKLAVTSQQTVNVSFADVLMVPGQSYLDIFFRCQFSKCIAVRSSVFAVDEVNSVVAADENASCHLER